MGMDYIKVHSKGNNFSIHFAGEFWVFFVLTFILLAITMTLYFWYLRHNRKLESQNRDEEKKYASSIVY